MFAFTYTHLEFKIYFCINYFLSTNILCLHFGFKNVAVEMDLALEKIESPLNFHVLLSIHYKHTNSRIFLELNDRRIFTLGIMWERLTFSRHIILFLSGKWTSLAGNQWLLVNPAMLVVLSAKHSKKAFFGSISLLRTW